MSTSIDWHNPPSGGYTTDDLDEMPEDGFRRELIDGVLHVSPSPAPFHQTLAAKLVTRLEEICPEPYAVTQGVEVRISHRRSLIPDVQVVLADAIGHRPRSRFSPDQVVLAIEIVSPSSQAMDRFAKPGLYAAAGIVNYWRIEIENGIEVFTYQLDAVTEAYRLTGEFDEEIDVAAPWPIKLPVSAITPRFHG